MGKISDFFTSNNPSSAAYTSKALDDLEWKVGQMTEKTNIDQGKGFIFEYLENVKINKQNAAKGLRYENTVTGLSKDRGGLGASDSPVDLMVKGVPYQAKVHKNPVNYIDDLNNSKYKDMAIRVPSDHYQTVVDEIDDRYKNGMISKEQHDLLRSRVSKGLTKSDELYEYSEDGHISVSKTDKLVEKYKNIAVLEDCLELTKITTITHAISTGVISSVKNVNDLIKGKIDSKECFSNIMKDTFKGAGRGLFVGSIGSGFLFIGHKFAKELLKNNSVSLTLANGVFDIGAAYREMMRGNISAADFVSQVVVKSIVSIATLFATVSLITHPVLRMMSITIMNIITDRLLKETKIDNLYLENAATFNQEFAIAIENENNKHIAEMKHILIRHKKAYESAEMYLKEIEMNNNVDEVNKSMVQLASVLDLNVKLESFDEFRTTMKEKKEIKF